MNKGLATRRTRWRCGSEFLMYVTIRKICSTAFSLALCLQMGCASLYQTSIDRHAFETSQRLFTQLVRWGEFERASEYVSAEQREQFLDAAPDPNMLRFSDYEIHEAQFTDDGEQATVRVTYHSYSVDSFIELVVEETQRWHFDKPNERWVVRSGINNFESGSQLGDHQSPSLREAY